MATNAPYAIRRIFPVIVLLLVPLNGSVAFFHLLPKAASFIITAVIGLVIAGALILRQCAANHAALLTFHPKISIMRI